MKIANTDESMGETGTPYCLGAVLGIEPRACHMLSKFSAIRLYHQPWAKTPPHCRIVYKWPNYFEDIFGGALLG